MELKITKLDTEVFHHESWKSIYFRVRRSKGQGHETQKSANVGFCTVVGAGFFLFLLCSLWIVCCACYTESESSKLKASPL